MNEPLDVLDAQVHLTLELDETAISASMDALGISSVLLDEFWHVPNRAQAMSGAVVGGAFRPMSPYAQAAALRHPDRFSYLQRVERRDPQLAELMAVLATSPGCRAVRVVILSRDEREAFSAGGYDGLLGHAQRHRLPVCLMGIDVGHLPAVAARFPELPIVLDHCGWPRSPGHWEQILTTSAIPTVHLKWSHAARAFGDEPGQQRELLRAIDCFGTARMLWAADITHEDSDASWAQLLGFVRDNPALSPGDKQQILAGTARRLFGWPAPQTPQS